MPPGSNRDHQLFYLSIWHPITHSEIGWITHSQEGNALHDMCLLLQVRNEAGASSFTARLSRRRQVFQITV